MGRARKPLADRFWAKVDRRGPGECWPWRGAASSGYGKFWVNGRLERASRVSWELANSVIPDGQSVLHRCDNPLCVNPAHLFLGDQADNVADMVAKGRLSVGPGRWNAKLTVEQVREIRSAAGTQLAIALRFGVDRTTVQQIRGGRLWRHVA